MKFQHIFEEWTGSADVSKLPFKLVADPTTLPEIFYVRAKTVQSLKKVSYQHYRAGEKILCQSSRQEFIGAENENTSAILCVCT